MGSRTDERHVDARIAALAAAQHGVVHRAQLLRAGLTSRRIALRLEHGLLVPLFRGVYAFGHAQLRGRGHLLAATWSGGSDAKLCDLAAAHLHDLRSSSAARVDVLRPRRAPWTPQPGVRAHISTTLRPQDVVVVDGIPVTSIARTVVDLAARHPARLVERVLDEMVALRVYDQMALDEQLRRPYVRGTRQLGAILRAHVPGTTATKLELEELLLGVCDAHGLPRPRCNDWVAGLEVDARWPRTPVVAELDSVRFHSSRAAFERDREKQNLLVAAGFVVLRFTWRQLTEDPDGAARAIRSALR
ncbi:MAG: hypothetical protein JWO90_502 [Solirubrobacterales bacterium]|jgi:hypothetical protein|nr:hypothetical protein [Solirubrobacterales bacterium]